MTWPTVKLGDISKRGQYGSGAAASPFEEGLPRYIRITDIDENGNLKPEKVGLKSSDWDSYVLEEGDLLFARSGATVGKTYLAKEADGHCVYAGYLIRFQLDKSKASPAYISHFTHSADYLRWVAAKQNVVAQPNINAKQYADLEIPLPPLEEQKRLAAILDRAAELRRMRLQVLAGLDELAQSLFLELFGDPATNPKGWDVVRLGEILKVVGGYAFKSEHFSELGAGIVRISNIQNRAIQLNNLARIPTSMLGTGAKFSVNTGELLIAMSGATTGKIGIVPPLVDEKLFLNQRVGNIKPNSEKTNIEFLTALFESEFFQKWIQELAWGAAQPNISGKQIESIEIPLPPLALQQQFAQQIEELAAIKVRARASLIELDALFAALQARAFAGELSGTM